MSRQFASVLLIVALVVAACGEAPEFDGWCYSFVFDGGERTPAGLTITEGSLTENGIESVEIAESFHSIIFDFEVLPFVQVDDIRFLLYNLTDPLVTVGAAATGTVFGQSANVSGDLAADENQVWIAGTYLDDFVSGRVVEVTIQADGPISLYQLQVGGDDDVSPFGVDDCAPATATPEPTITQTPEITNTPEPTNTPTPVTYTPTASQTPTESYDYCTVVTVDGNTPENPVATYSGTDWDGSPESPYPGIRFWVANLASSKGDIYPAEFLPWEEGTPYKVRGFRVYVGRYHLISSSAGAVRIRFLSSGLIETYSYTAMVNNSIYATGLTVTNGYYTHEGGTLAGADSLEIPYGSSYRIDFIAPTVGGYGGSTRNGFWSDIELDVCGPPIGDPTATPTPTPTITNTPTITPTRTAIPATAIATATSTNTAIVPATATSGPTNTAVPTSTPPPTSTPLPPPTPFEVTVDSMTLTAIATGYFGTPVESEITAIPPPSTGTVPPTIDKGPVYNSLATAAQIVNELPDDITDFVPDGAFYEGSFGIAKWIVSGYSLQELFGPTLAPIGLILAAAFLVVLSFVVIFFLVRILSFLVAIILRMVGFMRG